ncbi:MAG TPA: two-component sensor histidine kinase, partial [Microbacterium sp.]|nr:two-component sensor histidine kinase [Microbacterium sp.]
MTDTPSPSAEGRDAAAVATTAVPASAPATESAEAPPANAARARRPWTLQRKLIVTVVSITSFILVLVAVATSAILAQVLESQLDAEVKAERQSAEFIRQNIL